MAGIPFPVAPWDAGADPARTTLEGAPEDCDESGQVFPVISAGGSLTDAGVEKSVSTGGRRSLRSPFGSGPG
jgi:hypothetical protein